MHSLWYNFISSHAIVGFLPMKGASFVNSTCRHSGTVARRSEGKVRSLPGSLTSTHLCSVRACCRLEARPCVQPDGLEQMVNSGREF
jgi:hypothetical protein